jgi:hypothetical protein
MIRRTELLTYSVALAVFLMFLYMTFQLEYYHAQRLPFLALGIGIAFTVAGIIRTSTAKETELQASAVRVRGEEETSWRKYLIFAWLAAVFLAFYVFGIVLGTAVFVGLYTKFYGARWWASLLFAVFTAAFIFLLFGFALGVYLYNGLFLPADIFFIRPV